MGLKQISWEKEAALAADLRLDFGLNPAEIERIILLLREIAASRTERERNSGKVLAFPANANRSRG